MRLTASRSCLGSLCPTSAFFGVTLPRWSALRIDGSELRQLLAGARVELAEPRVAAVGARQQLGLVQQAVVADQVDERLLVPVAVVASLIPWSAPAIRRSRMIWLIGATPFGHASMQLKQCVQS